MKIVGITGGIGMGKSACADLLRQRGVPVIDTDDLAREVVEPGQPALAEIRRAFGAEVFQPDGRLRREVLARRVFADPAARKTLEGILHPRIRELWRNRLANLGDKNVALGVVVIPLLFETGAEADLDVTVCVACSPATQAERLAARGWTGRQIEDRIRAQWPVEQKISRANYVIWSEGSLAVHAAQVDKILAGLTTQTEKATP